MKIINQDNIQVLIDFEDGSTSDDFEGCYYDGFICKRMYDEAKTLQNELDLLPF